ncbi:MAG: regulatory protein RecX [Actinomycetota bacterium]
MQSNKVFQTGGFFPQNNKVFTITALTQQDKRPWRTSIFVNGQFWRGEDTETVIEFGLSEGQQLYADELEQLGYKFDKRRAMKRAVVLLSYRERSESEVSSRLQKAGFARLVVDGVIDELKQMNYLDDKAFSKTWIKNRGDRKLYGPRRIKQELKQKGISDEIISETLCDHISPDKEYESAKKLAELKLSSYKGLESKVACRRLSQFLLRRGYSPSVVYEVMRSSSKFLDTKNP